MPIINLIQEQRLAQQKRDQRSRLAFYGFIVVLSAGALGYGILFFERQAMESEVARLNTELDRTKPIVAQIEDCQRKQSTLKPRLDTLEEAQKMSDKWAGILRHLEVQTPSNTWLTGMQCGAVEQSKPINMVLTGSAKGQAPISEFILRVENEPDLANVTLHFTHSKQALNGGAIDFELAADVAGTEEVKKGLKEDQKS